ncbi:MAG: NADH-quinone oxidoreductase subunit F, partial [Actinomycetota bacterium]|nr:NADH-quinone oxidoreductase subunit F [Actinomycetota bacterium]
MSSLLFYDEIDRPGLASLKTYHELGGYAMLRQALESDQQSIIEQLLTSNVRGRGGAGFAMGRKA